MPIILLFIIIAPFAAVGAAHVAQSFDDPKPVHAELAEPQLQQ